MYTHVFFSPLIFAGLETPPPSGFFLIPEVAGADDPLLSGAKGLFTDSPRRMTRSSSNVSFSSRIGDEGCKQALFVSPAVDPEFINSLHRMGRLSRDGQMPSVLIELSNHVVSILPDEVGSNWELMTAAVTQMPGNTNIGLHSDEAWWGAMFATVQLQGQATVELSRDGNSHQHRLDPGSVYVLSGEVRYAPWKHAISNDGEMRLSVTFSYGNAADAAGSSVPQEQGGKPFDPEEELAKWEAWHQKLVDNTLGKGSSQLETVQECGFFAGHLDHVAPPQGSSSDVLATWNSTVRKACGVVSPGLLSQAVEHGRRQTPGFFDGMGVGIVQTVESQMVHKGDALCVWGGLAVLGDLPPLAVASCMIPLSDAMGTSFAHVPWPENVGVMINAAFTEDEANCTYTAYRSRGRVEGVYRVYIIVSATKDIPYGVQLRWLYNKESIRSIADFEGGVGLYSREEQRALDEKHARGMRARTIEQKKVWSALVAGSSVAAAAALT